ncbi:hypothetical protein B0J14DRAFT_314934 [Halenospora varia]|nr:hypothetical protein B0J14DRAFT_314934 [Halenospora varia]
MRYPASRAAGAAKQARGQKAISGSASALRSFFVGPTCHGKPARQFPAGSLAKIPCRTVHPLAHRYSSLLFFFCALKHKPSTNPSFTELADRVAASDALLWQKHVPERTHHLFLNEHCWCLCEKSSRCCAECIDSHFLRILEFGNLSCARTHLLSYFPKQTCSQSGLIISKV